MFCKLACVTACQAVARGLLVNAGLVVDGVSDGEEAVACARRHDHSLILMDMKMPVMEGLQATRAIRPLPERSLVPTLAMTGNAFAEGRDRCLATGMNGHTGKSAGVEYALGHDPPVAVESSSPTRL